MLVYNEFPLAKYSLFIAVAYNITLLKIFLGTGQFRKLIRRKLVECIPVLGQAIRIVCTQEFDKVFPDVAS